MTVIHKKTPHMANKYMQHAQPYSRKPHRNRALDHPETEVM